VLKKMMNRWWAERDKEVLRRIVLSWFEANQRPLPWRRTYDPYQVWISEIMGQQTQMDRVVEYFERWMELFPDVAAVASAPEQQILKAWEGLGYYSRARNIHRSAQLLLQNHGGLVPNDPELLHALPGIGTYTAAAILSIAYNVSCPVVDANVERVLARVFDLDKPLKSGAGRKEVQALAADLLPPGQARLFNQALMEFGALVCRAKNPACECCPLAGDCQALRSGTVNQRPVPVPKAKRIDLVMVSGIIVRGGRLYIQQRRPDDLWGSLWEFPGGHLGEGESPLQSVCRKVQKETAFRVTEARPLLTVRHQYTKYRVVLHGFLCSLSGVEDFPLPDLHTAVQSRWVSLTAIHDFPFSAGHRKLLAHLSSLVL